MVDDSYHIVFRVHSVFLILLIGAIIAIESEDEVRFVNVVFRHGNRVPEGREYELFTMDLNYNSTFYPMTLGELTNEGKRNMYKLGAQLRNRYDDFLGDIYVPEDVSATSSDVPRTKMSLGLVLAALYPPAEIQKWNPQLNWQPIPIDYIPSERDTLFLPQYKCLRFKQELERINLLPAVIAEIEEFRPLIAKLANITGQRLHDMKDLWSLYNGLVAASSLNLTLPQWTNDIFPDGPLRDAMIMKYKIWNYNDLLKKLKSGKILKRIIDNMRSTANGSLRSPRKINLFSGHEPNVASLLITLSVFKPHVPEYSSAVIIELVSRDGQHYVKVVHYLGIPAVFEEQEIPDCGKLCPLDKFADMMKNVTAAEKELDCMSLAADG